MHIAILQHASVEGPGVFEEMLTEDGHTFETTHLYAGDSLPSVDKFDALWVLGGPMDVWQEDEHPWLKAEKELIRDVVEVKGMPFFGLCLGHQLLAEALGGEVGLSETPEIGIMDVQLTEVGATGILFDGLPETFECLQWHSAEVKKLPVGAEVLATSPDCAVQAMKWGPRAFSLQFHVELQDNTIPDWATIDAYSDALTAALGEGAATRLAKEASARMPEFNKMSERLYINWLQTSAQAHSQA